MKNRYSDITPVMEIKKAQRSRYLEYHPAGDLGLGDILIRPSSQGQVT
jgi:hypothetical protein